MYGVSLDSVQDQARFAKAQELNFPLLSDPDGSAGVKYGVLAPGARFTARATFVLDDRGVLRAALPRVSPTTHGEELVTLLESLMDE